MTITLTPADWLALFTHFLSLSLLAVGGAIATAPDMHRYLVGARGWLSDGQFSASIALAQAAPGHNVLFVGLVGWNVGLNAGGGSAVVSLVFVFSLGGVGVAMLGMLIPSGILTYTATRWLYRHRGLRAVRAFKAGMAPIVVALLIATGWLLTAAHDQPARDAPLWLLTAAATLIVWRTRLHLLWLIGAGAVLGMLGLV